jgi:thiol-disulfide isomerase/thioredoxin
MQAAPGPLPVTLSDPVAGDDVELRPGAPVLHVVFFATWCPACVDELDRLADLEMRWAESGYRLVVVAVAARQEPRRLARFASDRRPPGLFLHDREGRAQKSFGADRLPAHFLLDSSGAILARSGALDDAFMDALKRYLRERERGRGRQE